MSSCAVALQVCPKVDFKSYSALFAFRKANLSLVVRVLTGHCPIDIHAVRLRTLTDVSCKSCLKEDELETI